MKDKTQSNNTMLAQNKKITPVKNANQKGINVNHSSVIQTSKSPYKQQKQSNAGLMISTNNNNNITPD